MTRSKSSSSDEALKEWKRNTLDDCWRGSRIISLHFIVQTKSQCENHSQRWNSKIPTREDRTRTNNQADPIVEAKSLSGVIEKVPQMKLYHQSKRQTQHKLRSIMVMLRQLEIMMLNCHKSMERTREFIRVRELVVPRLSEQDEAHQRNARAHMKDD